MSVNRRVVEAPKLCLAIFIFTNGHGLGMQDGVRGGGFPGPGRYGDGIGGGGGAARLCAASCLGASILRLQRLMGPRTTPERVIPIPREACALDHPYRRSSEASEEHVSARAARCPRDTGIALGRTLHLGEGEEVPGRRMLKLRLLRHQPEHESADRTLGPNCSSAAVQQLADSCWWACAGAAGAAASAQFISATTRTPPGFRDVVNVAFPRLKPYHQAPATDAPFRWKACACKRPPHHNDNHNHHHHHKPLSPITTLPELDTILSDHHHRRLVIFCLTPTCHRTPTPEEESWYYHYGRLNNIHFVRVELGEAEEGLEEGLMRCPPALPSGPKQRGLLRLRPIFTIGLTSSSGYTTVSAQQTTLINGNQLTQNACCLRYISLFQSTVAFSVNFADSTGYTQSFTYGSGTAQANPIILLFAASDIVTTSSPVGISTPASSSGFGTTSSSAGIPPPTSASFNIPSNSAPANSSPTTTPLTVPTANGSETPSNLSADTKAGIAVGTSLAGALLLTAFMVILRYRRENQKLRKEAEVKSTTPPDSPGLHNESRVPGSELLGEEIHLRPTLGRGRNGPELHNQSQDPGIEILGEELYQLPTQKPRPETELQGSAIHELPVYLGDSEPFYIP
ncbi:hypothetical protein G7Y89_g1238 [Cudoniella acicularis]|uniref:Uncharacterized protein n=1 Tax=Cudoniella acicularis TaxID=354080 RepID=A0A8H4RVN5_9HELO|nr:hypothetical protein G7Y89_g1238 [Cudoniella acicularis]